MCGGEPRDAKHGPRFHVDCFWQRHRLIRGQADMSCCRAEGPLPLPVPDPDTLPNPSVSDTFTDGHDPSRTVAVRDDPAQTGVLSHRVVHRTVL